MWQQFHSIKAMSTSRKTTKNHNHKCKQGPLPRYLTRIYSLSSFFIRVHCFRICYHQFLSLYHSNDACFITEILLSYPAQRKLDLILRANLESHSLKRQHQENLTGVKQISVLIISFSPTISLDRGINRFITEINTFITENNTNLCSAGLGLHHIVKNY